MFVRVFPDNSQFVDLWHKDSCLGSVECFCKHFLTSFLMILVFLLLYYYLFIFFLNVVQCCYDRKNKG